MRAHRWLLPTLLVTMVFGCAAETEEDELRDAVPAVEALRIAVPGEDTDDSTALIGERAALYQFTRDTSRHVNGTLWAVMHLVETIVEHPPTVVGDGHALWGPWNESLSPLTYRFAVDRAAPGQYRFLLQGKPRDAGDDAFVALLAGETERRLRAGVHRGTIGLDLDAAHALDAGEHPDRGRIAARWDLGTNPRLVEAGFEGFEDGDEGSPVSALYRYTESRDGTGTFEFAARADLDDEGELAEDLIVTSRWDATGAGRGDAIATQGDLGEAAVYLSECWDSGFGRSYYGDNIGHTEGDAASCAFAEAYWRE